MSEPFIGQILFAAFPYAPRNYANCDGATLAINQNQALFALLGVTYGGNGQTTFNLPDLRGRTPVGAFGSRDAGWQPPQTTLGQVAGSEGVQLTTAQIPSHTHSINVSTSAGNAASLAGATFGVAAVNFYAPADGNMVGLTGSPMTNAGANVAHDNMQPYTVIEAAIAIAGIYPTRN